MNCPLGEAERGQLREGPLHHLGELGQEPLRHHPRQHRGSSPCTSKYTIHILPVVSQILRLSKPFISCYFVMSSEGLWACCLLLIGYKDGSLLRENLNFLMVNARGYFGLGDLLHLVSISNELYNSGLLASTYLKIIGLKVHYSIGREFFQTTSQTPKLYSCKQKP